MRNKSIKNWAIIVVLLYIVISLVPFFLIFINSVKTVGELGVNPYGLPVNPTLANYKAILSWEYTTIGVAFDSPPFLPALLLSLVVSSVCVVLSLWLGLMGAYGISRYKIGGGILPFWILSLLFAPPIIFAFPLYVMYKKLGVIDNPIALVGANLTFVLPFAIWIFYSYLKDTPNDIEEAAMVDGAGIWIIFWKIVTPMMKSACAAVGALVFIFTWNEYLFSTILMNTMKTITATLGGFNTGQMVLYGAISAGIIIGIIPSMLILVFFGKYLATGLSFGTLK